MSKKQQLRIIAKHVAEHANGMTNVQNIRLYYARMEQMVELLEFDIHEYKEILQEYTHRTLF